MAYAINVTNFINGKVSRLKVLDFVEKKLIEQGKAATMMYEKGRSRCVYRAPDGCKCAFGHLIPDDKYKADFDIAGNNGIPTILKNNAIHFNIDEHGDFSYDNNDKVAFLMSLQEVHDNAGLARDSESFVKRIQHNFNQMRVALTT